MGWNDFGFKPSEQCRALFSRSGSASRPPDGQRALHCGSEEQGCPPALDTQKVLYIADWPTPCILAKQVSRRIGRSLRLTLSNPGVGRLLPKGKGRVSKRALFNPCWLVIAADFGLRQFDAAVILIQAVWYQSRAR